MLSHLAGLRVGEIASLRTAIRWKTASGPSAKDSRFDFFVADNVPLSGKRRWRGCDQLQLLVTAGLSTALRPSR